VAISANRGQERRDVRELLPEDGRAPELDQFRDAFRLC